MQHASKSVRRSAKRAKYALEAFILSYPKHIRCNICAWTGAHFLDDPWHTNVICPRCRSSVRQRLFFAALQNIEAFSFDKLITGKRILHFAPEDIVRLSLQRRAGDYVTADYLRKDCDMNLDMCNMSEVQDEAFDAVIAFDVLEHVLDYKKALQEVHRILSTNGFGIFTVPQKDNLLNTYEDPLITDPHERVKRFGQWDHLRIFGDDFTDIVQHAGFLVTAVDESTFPEEQVRKSVLFPPVLSKQPLATNFRKVFFCHKTSH